jgi:3-phosphoshikimate 1-carboxyvinyltransferase
LIVLLYMLEIRQITNKELKGEVILPVSKSISNRFLIMQALTGGRTYRVGVSASNDERLLQNALEVRQGVVNFEDAGTPMRLYLAYASFLGLDILIDGSERLRSRPVKPLINALEQLGAQFEFPGKADQLPVKIKKGVDKAISDVELEVDLSSQFLSALLLIGPYFDRGLLIKTKGKLVSGPYVEMTIDGMRKSGVRVYGENGNYKIEPGTYRFGEPLVVEKDWSAATFIYALASVADEAEIFIPGLFLDSVQGDRAAAAIFKTMGVVSTQKPDGITIHKAAFERKLLKLDFSVIPDMFPAICAVCAALNIPAKFSGVKNLVLKESDRIEAMRVNLEQTGTEIIMNEEDAIELLHNGKGISSYMFRSFNDHRIAMACSIFALQKDICIDDETVVKKSFPEYWNVFGKLTVGG